MAKNKTIKKEIKDENIASSNSFFITPHAKERYAQRIMKKKNKTDIAVFLYDHDDKVERDIRKMVQYGELIYSGENKIKPGMMIHIYKNGEWLLVLNQEETTLITLYKVIGQSPYVEEYEGIISDEETEDIAITETHSMSRMICRSEWMKRWKYKNNTRRTRSTTTKRKFCLA